MPLSAQAREPRQAEVVDLTLRAASDDELRRRATLEADRDAYAELARRGALPAPEDRAA